MKRRSSVARSTLGTLVAAVAAAVLGCSGATKDAASRAGAAGSASASASIGLAATCPPITDAELEPAARPTSASTFTLGDLFPRDQPHVEAPVLRLNLGVFQQREYGSETDRERLRTTRPHVRFDAGWLEGGVRAELQAEYGRWVAGTDRRAHGGRRMNLLDRRLRLLDALGELPGAPADLDARRRCAVDAEREAKEERDAGARDELAARRALSVAYSGTKPTTANDRFLAAYLSSVDMDELAERGRPFYQDLADRYRAVADDAAAPALLRRVALREVAYAARRWAARDASPWLRKLVELTDDPVYALPARFDLAVEGDVAATRRADLAALVPSYEAAIAREPDGSKSVLRADLPRLFMHLGREAWNADDAPAAIAAWVRCLATASLDEDSDDDPFGCASDLAKALNATGGASGATSLVAVPDTFAAVLGVRVVRNAIEVRDRAEAARAGDLALARAPDAEDAPLVIALLGDLTNDAATKRALLDRRNADYGVGTAWYRRARLRAAATTRNDPLLRSLFEPNVEAPPRPPTTEDEWRTELHDDRVPKFQRACVPAFTPEKATLTVVIDTTGPFPRAKVTGGAKSKEAVACVERVVGLYFRSVPPAEITLVFQPYR